MAKNCNRNALALALILSISLHVACAESNSSSVFVSNNQSSTVVAAIPPSASRNNSATDVASRTSISSSISLNGSSNTLEVPFVNQTTVTTLVQQQLTTLSSSNLGQSITASKSSSSFLSTTVSSGNSSSSSNTSLVQPSPTVTDSVLLRTSATEPLVNVSIVLTTQSASSRLVNSSSQAHTLDMVTPRSAVITTATNITAVTSQQGKVHMNRTTQIAASFTESSPSLTSVTVIASQNGSTPSLFNASTPSFVGKIASTPASNFSKTVMPSTRSPNTTSVISLVGTTQASNGSQTAVASTRSPDTTSVVGLVHSSPASNNSQAGMVSARPSNMTSIVALDASGTASSMSSINQTFIALTTASDRASPVANRTASAVVNATSPLGVRTVQTTVAVTQSGNQSKSTATFILAPSTMSSSVKAAVPSSSTSRSPTQLLPSPSSVHSPLQTALNLTPNVSTTSLQVTLTGNKTSSVSQTPSPALSPTYIITMASPKNSTTQILRTSMTSTTVDQGVTKMATTVAVPSSILQNTNDLVVASYSTPCYIYYVVEQTVAVSVEPANVTSSKKVPSATVNLGNVSSIPTSKATMSVTTQLAVSSTAAVVVPEATTFLVQQTSVGATLTQSSASSLMVNATVSSTTQSKVSSKAATNVTKTTSSASRPLTTAVPTVTASISPSSVNVSREHQLPNSSLQGLAVSSSSSSASVHILLPASSINFTSLQASTSAVNQSQVLSRASPTFAITASPTITSSASHNASYRATTMLGTNETNSTTVLSAASTNSTSIIGDQKATISSSAVQVNSTVFVVSSTLPGGTNSTSVIGAQVATSSSHAVHVNSTVSVVPSSASPLRGTELVSTPNATITTNSTASATTYPNTVSAISTTSTVSTKAASILATTNASAAKEFVPATSAPVNSTQSWSSFSQREASPTTATLSFNSTTVVPQLETSSLSNATISKISFATPSQNTTIQASTTNFFTTASRSEQLYPSPSQAYNASMTVQALSRTSNVSSTAATVSVLPTAQASVNGLLTATSVASVAATTVAPARRRRRRDVVDNFVSTASNASTSALSISVSSTDHSSTQSVTPALSSPLFSMTTGAGNSVNETSVTAGQGISTLHQAVASTIADKNTSSVSVPSVSSTTGLAHQINASTSVAATVTSVAASVTSVAASVSSVAASVTSVAASSTVRIVATATASSTSNIVVATTAVTQPLNGSSKASAVSSTPTSNASTANVEATSGVASASPNSTSLPVSSSSQQASPVSVTMATMPASSSSTVVASMVLYNTSTASLIAEATPTRVIQPSKSTSSYSSGFLTSITATPRLTSVTQRLSSSSTVAVGAPKSVNLTVTTSSSVSDNATTSQVVSSTLPNITTASQQSTMLSNQTQVLRSQGRTSTAHGVVSAFTASVASAPSLVYQTAIASSTATVVFPVGVTSRPHSALHVTPIASQNSSVSVQVSRSLVLQPTATPKANQTLTTTSASVISVTPSNASSGTVIQPSRSVSSQSREHTAVSIKPTTTEFSTSSVQSSTSTTPKHPLMTLSTLGICWVVYTTRIVRATITPSSTSSAVMTPTVSSPSRVVTVSVNSTLSSVPLAASTKVLGNATSSTKMLASSTKVFASASLALSPTTSLSPSSLSSTSSSVNTSSSSTSSLSSSSLSSATATTSLLQKVNSTTVVASALATPSRTTTSAPTNSTSVAATSAATNSTPVTATSAATNSTSIAASTASATSSLTSSTTVVLVTRRPTTITSAVGSLTLVPSPTSSASSTGLTAASTSTTAALLTTQPVDQSPIASTEASIVITPSSTTSTVVPTSSVIPTSSVTPTSPSNETMLVLRISVPTNKNVITLKLEDALAGIYSGAAELARRKRRAVGDIQVTITDIKRVSPLSENVDVKFYVTNKGVPVNASHAAAVFNKVSSDYISDKVGYPVKRTPYPANVPTTTQPPTNVIVSMIFESSAHNLTLQTYKAPLELRLAAYFKEKKTLGASIVVVAKISKVEIEVNKQYYVEFYITVSGVMQQGNVVVEAFKVQDKVQLTAQLEEPVAVLPYTSGSLTASDKDYLITRMSGPGIAAGSNLDDPALKTIVENKLELVYKAGKAASGGKRKRRAVGSITAKIVNITMASGSADEGNVIFFIFDSGQVANASYVSATFNKLSKNEMAIIAAPYSILTPPVPLYPVIVTDPPPQPVPDTTVPYWIIGAVLGPLLFLLIVILLIWWKCRCGPPPAKEKPVLAMEEHKTRMHPTSGFDVARYAEGKDAMKTTPLKAAPPMEERYEKPSARETSLRRKVGKTPLKGKTPSRVNQAYEESEEEDEDEDQQSNGSRERIVKAQPGPGMKRKPIQPVHEKPLHRSTPARPARGIVEDDEEEDSELSETQSEPESEATTRTDNTRFSAAQVPAVAVMGGSSGPPRYPPVRFRSSVHPAPSLPPIDAQQTSLVGAKVELPSTDQEERTPRRDKRRSKATQLELKQKADIERLRNKQRQRERKNKGYSPEDKRSWAREQHNFDRVLDPRSEDPFAKGKKRRGRKSRKVGDIPTTDDDGIELKSFKPLKKGREEVELDRESEESSGEESNISMDETRKRMHLLLEDAFSLLEPYKKRQLQMPEQYPTDPRAGSLMRPPAPPRYAGSRPALPEPPPAHGRASEPTPRQRRRLQDTEGYPPPTMPRTPLGYGGYPIRPQMRPPPPLVTSDPVVVWDPYDRQRYVNQRQGGQPTYSYTDPQTGQSVYITPVQQQRDNYGTAVWSPYGAEDTMADLYPDLAKSGYPGALGTSPPKHDPYLTPNAKSRDTIIDMKSNDPLDQRADTLGASPQPLIRSIKQELMRLSNGGPRKTPITEL